jgi:hypothetical protein
MGQKSGVTSGVRLAARAPGESSPETGTISRGRVGDPLEAR